MPYIGQRPATGEHNSFKILDDISNYTLTFGSSDVDVSADTITAREHRFVTGQRVTYGNGGGTAPTGLSNSTVYYIIVEDRHTFKLATSASNAVAGTAINITAAGSGAAHTINVTFDGVNTKFKATHSNGTKADISQSGQLMVSVNGVLQQPHDNTTTPSTGYATDHTSTIIFSAAPAAGDQFFGRLIASNFATFDISDNTVDNFTGDGSTSTFTLSKTPPNNESILVTIDGVVQYPDDNAAVRAYTVSENVLDFASAPGNAVEIQVRHIGFAGASTAAVSGFYGRTGNAALKNTDDIVFRNANVGVVTATDIRVTGNLTVDGTTTTLDTELVGVDKLEVAANNTTSAGIITQTGSGDILRLYDGSTEVFSVTDGGKVLIGTETAGINGAHNLTIGESGHGGITIRTGTTSAGAIYFADSTSGDAQFDGFIQYNQQTRYLRFGTAQAEQVRITSGGLVGIGTDIPESNSRLHTFTTQTTARTITETAAASGYAGYRLTNGTGYWEMQVDGSNQGLRFLDDGTERLRITSNGGVLIGGHTTAVDSGNAPNIEIVNTSTSTLTLARNDTTIASGHDIAAIRVWGNDSNGTYQQCAEILAEADGDHGTGDKPTALAFKVTADGASSPTERLRITSGGQVLIGEPTNYANANADDLIVGNRSNNESGITIGSANQGQIAFADSGDNRAGLIHYQHTDNSMRFMINGATNERLRITSSGELISNNGTLRRNVSDSSFTVSGDTASNAGANINLYGASHSSLANVFRVRTGSTERFRVDSDGRLLTGGAVAANAWAGGDDLIIGNATSGTRSGITLVSGSNTDGGLYWSDGNSGTALFQGQLVYNHSNSRMQFYTAGSSRVTIDDAGRLLIGRTTALASSAERLTIDSGMAIFRRNSTNAAALYIRNEDTTADTRQPYLIFTDGGGNRGGFGVQYNESSLWISGQNGIAFRTSGSAPSQNERLRIDSSGRVKIGSISNHSDGVTHAPVYIAMQTDITDIQDDEGGATAGLVRIEETGSNNNRYHGIDLRNTNSGDIRILNQDVGVSDRGDLVIAMPDGDASDGVHNKMRFNSRKSSIQISGKGGAVAANTATEHTDIYIATKTGMTALNHALGGETAGLIRFEDKGSNDSRYHGIELRNRNSGDIRILNLDEGTTNKANLVFGVDNGNTCVEALRIKSSGVVKGSHGFMDGGSNAAGFFQLAASAGNTNIDTGISVNASNGGGAMMVLASRNTSGGTSTAAGMYLLDFRYDGNHVPGVTFIGGDNFCTFGKTAGNNLTVNCQSGNWSVAAFFAGYGIGNQL